MDDVDVFEVLADNNDLVDGLAGLVDGSDPVAELTEVFASAVDGDERRLVLASVLRSVADRLEQQAEGGGEGEGEDDG